jgi:hypothetical protein
LKEIAMTISLSEYYDAAKLIRTIPPKERGLVVDKFVAFFSRQQNFNEKVFRLGCDEHVFVDLPPES